MMGRDRYFILWTVILAVVFLLVGGGISDAQVLPDAGTYTARIYHVNYGAYPIVQAYIRTWDDSRDPLQNVNIANIGIQVKGRNYNPETAIAGRQYAIQTLEGRQEGFRTVFVLDASGTMAGAPFSEALTSLRRFIEMKRPVDQVAVLAIRDTNTGYEVVSRFESNPALLYQRIADVRADGQQTRLYDTVAAALEMCATAVRGDSGSMEYPVLSTIVILSDGKDEGSAISRSELISRIGQLDIPIPIHSIAFTRIGRDHLLNMEALSRATFGRYWDLEDTQYLTRTMEHIHRINRSDYVVMFRSYVPVDGESHTFRIGIEYPSGSGSFIFSSAEFDSIESPARFSPSLAQDYEELLARFPDNEAAAFGQPVSQTMTTPSPEQGAVAEDVPPSPRPDPEPAHEDEDDEYTMAAFLEDNGLLVAAGVIIVLLLLIIVVWVKRGSNTAHAAAGSTSTAHRERHSTTGVSSRETATKDRESR